MENRPIDEVFELMKEAEYSLKLANRKYIEFLKSINQKTDMMLDLLKDIPISEETEED